MSVLDRYNGGWIEDDQLIMFLRDLSNIEIGGNRIYDGQGTHFMQNPNEFMDLLHFLLLMKFKFKFRFDRFLEFGWSTGISHTILTKVLKFTESVAVDLVEPSGINTGTFLANLRFKNLTFIANDSKSEFTLNKLQLLAPFDFVFIDGGHDYLTARSDFELALKVVGEKGVIALHDIYAIAPCEVDKLWAEIKSEYCTYEFYDSRQTIKYGIGLVAIGVENEFLQMNKESFRCRETI